MKLETSKIWFGKTRPSFKIVSRNRIAPLPCLPAEPECWGQECVSVSVSELTNCTLQMKRQTNEERVTCTSEVFVANAIGRRSVRQALRLRGHKIGYFQRQFRFQVLTIDRE